MRFQTKNGVLMHRQTEKHCGLSRGEKIPYVSAQPCFRNFPEKTGR